MARSFYAESKRVRNDRIKDELGVTLRYPDYRTGLRSCCPPSRRIEPPPNHENRVIRAQDLDQKGPQAMKSILTTLMLCAVLLGAGCSKFVEYTGPEVTRVEVNKSTRVMTLWHYDQVLETYDVELGFDPLEHKFQEGDGRTPEGEYIIDRRNPNSEFYLSIGIDYPNEADIAAAEEAGVDPGGDIFIHGTPRPFARIDDWTAGCIAVTNREMRQIYAMVQDGTPITILP
jgi:L,D-peptidoglycan transpeptidase YkuD (ErfK/YbiS/YcfS/YnhG family)